MKYLIYKYIRASLKMLFWVSIAAIIAVCIYVFYHSESNILGISFTNPIYEYVKNMYFWVYIVLYFIVFSVLSTFVFISLSHYFNVKRDQRLKIRDRYYRFFTYILTSYFLIDLYRNENQRKKLFLKIKPHLKTRTQILALFQSYLKIQDTITKNLSDDFKLLLNDLNLQIKLESLIYNKDFDDRILAIRMLSFLQIHTCDKQIMVCGDSDNFALRTEAYAGLVRLMEKDEHLLNFIGEKHKLSILDINVIVNEVLKNKKMDINYRALLSSSNQQKIIIGLILAKYRYRKNRNNLILIIEHIGSSNDLINNLAWDALLTLIPDDDCVDIIIDRFENEPDNIKLNILEKSHHVMSKRFFNFLVKIIGKQSLIVKIEAMKIIFKNDFDLLENFMNSENDEIKMAYKETACMYINQQF
ncbi:hypothetical protein [Ancylomarina sp. 16SWW S1-10-2]|uniref:hypothetical protein n=1 Tax=Ancylomarina sp. 16SWW S1-10-2 TaxID=2499681 RepID=UPI0012ADF4BB|nr:hypothetical protein [Ancylomarina sp. 16SWW S1-10-2]MRT93182.1 hypothetical protein [Ancylomarina sp. 16SWW S1-10-2]